MAGRKSVWEQIRSNAVALISLTVALVGLAYNTWRNEKTEANRNVREAAFLLMEEIVEFQSVVLFTRFADGGDEEATEGDYRRGWVHVIAIKDLSYNMPEEVQDATQQLSLEWENNVDSYADDDESYEKLDGAIDNAKQEILEAIMELD
ncbi:MAG: hypothetical protein AAF438_08170 [Pseudomonadota bacterium]